MKDSLVRVRNSNDGRIKKETRSGAWDWWSGQETQAWAKQTRQPTRETTERRWDVMQAAIFGRR